MYSDLHGDLVHLLWELGLIFLFDYLRSAIENNLWNDCIHLCVCVRVYVWCVCVWRVYVCVVYVVCVWWCVYVWSIQHKDYQENTQHTVM